MINSQAMDGVICKKAVNQFYIEHGLLALTEV